MSVFETSLMMVAQPGDTRRELHLPELVNNGTVDSELVTH